MNGTTAVSVPGTWQRINNIHAVTIGSGGVADGDVTVQNAGDTETYSQIDAGGNVGESAVFTIPAIDADGNTITKALIMGWGCDLVSDNKNTFGKAFLRATVDWGDRSLLSGVFCFQDVIRGQTGGDAYRKFPIPLPVPPKCDIKISAIRTTGAGALAASGGFSVLYEM